MKVNINEIRIGINLDNIFIGDNWNGIMKDTLREECESSDDCLRNCCVSPYFAPLFFVVFVLMAQFVLVNVVVAVLMKHLEESHKQVRSRLNVAVLIYLPRICYWQRLSLFYFHIIIFNSLRYEMVYSIF